ncbi:hypothetical protein BV499_05230 [Helicobacter pylori]|nr:hypothetical protein BV499_05230 [Helicobacter pylori]
MFELFIFWGFFLRNFFFKPFVLGEFDEKSFLVFFITNDKRACQKQAIILKMKKSFLAFLIIIYWKTCR